MECTPRSSRALPLRGIAVRELERMEKERAFVGLGRRRVRDNARDERRLTDLVSGSTRWKRRLDFIIDAFYQGDASAIQLLVRLQLRVGIYELLFTDSPVHAVLHENVESVRILVGERVTRLVNGVLRRVDRERAHLPQPDFPDEAENLAILHSHPTWMVRRWLKRLGSAATRDLLTFNNRRPHYGIRIRHGDTVDWMERFTEQDMRPEQSPYFDNFVRVSNLQPLVRSDFFELGHGLVQDEGAAGVVAVLDPQPGECILDACAAPGGKSLAIADRIGESGLLTAVDVSVSRLGLLRESADRLGMKNIVTDAVDLRGMKAGGHYDRILLDAPCSGFGVLGKRADMRWNRSPQDLDDLVGLQRDLLDATAEQVGPGGILVYATCTIEPEENEQQVRSFLQRQPEFVLEAIGPEIPSELKTVEGFYTSLPFLHGIDGAFAARLRRLERGKSAHPE